MRHTADEFKRVKELIQTGLSGHSIAAKTGVPRATVQRWRHRSRPPGSSRSSTAADWQVPDASTYCYLLGCYLGDGCITHKPPNAWSLTVACDRQHRSIMEEVTAAMATTFPGARPGRHRSSKGESDVVRISHRAIGRAFPQHGPGRKHLRPIVLADWQLALTHGHPRALIRGLIHSDGCRAINRFKTKLPSGRVAEYSYVRYFFSNLSEDIRRIFSEHCQLLDVRVTQSNPRNLSVAHRASVAILDSFIGPKS
jgi:hypothetical protein